MADLKKYDTTNYCIDILDEEEIQNLKGYGVQAAATESVMPNKYGVRNKQTKIIEYYCSNLAAALSVQNTLENGIQEEMQNRPKQKADLRSV